MRQFLCSGGHLEIGGHIGFFSSGPITNVFTKSNSIIAENVMLVARNPQYTPKYSPNCLTTLEYNYLENTFPSKES